MALLTSPGTQVTANIINNLPLIFSEQGELLWNKLAVLVSMVQKVRGMGGPSFNWTVSNGGNLTVARGESYYVSVATDAYANDKVQAQLNRCLKTTSFSISDREIKTTASFYPGFPIADIVRQVWMNEYLAALSTHMRTIEVALLTGTGTVNDPSGSPQTDFVGFLSLLIPAITGSGTYAGISFSSTSNPGMLGSGIDVGATNSGNLTRSILRNLFQQMRAKKGVNPKFGMVSPKTGTYFQGIADVQLRYNSQDFGKTLEVLGNVGFVNSYSPICSVDGCPVFENSAWGTSTLTSLGANGDGYAIFGDPDKMFLNYLPYDDGGSEVVDPLVGKTLDGVSSNGEDVRSVGLPVRSWLYAKTGAQETVTLETDCGFGIKSPPFFGILANITGYTSSS